MADHQAVGEIRAAGAVLWRTAGRGTQVAILHRPKYDDWSLAKGKVEPGEHVLLAAVREVTEETGLRVRLGLRLPAVRYLVDGQPKVVDYWAAQVDASAGTFTENHEVDRLDWVALSQADVRLSYDHDARLLAAFGAAPRPTMPIILVRHAAAGSKSDWRKHDALRPLDARGKQQARMLAGLLRCFGSGQVLSSPAERCLATVRPYADSIHAAVEPVPGLGLVPGDAHGKAARAAAAQELARAAAMAASTSDRPVVVCAHRENMPDLLAAVCEQLRADVPAGPPLRKGGFWVLHRAAGRLAGAERHHPEETRLPGSERRCRWLPVQRWRQCPLQDQQPALHLEACPAAVAAEPVTGQHPVARHDDGDGIGAHDLPDRAARRHVAGGCEAGLAGKRAVARGLAVANRTCEHLEDVPLRALRGRPVKRQLEIPAPPAEVLGELLTRGMREAAR